MYDIRLWSVWLFIALLGICYGDETDMKNSIENVILARQVVNEVNMRDYNQTNNRKQNETIDAMQKYLKDNPAVNEMLKEDKEDYTDGEKKGKVRILQ